MVLHCKCIWASAEGVWKGQGWLDADGLRSLSQTSCDACRCFIGIALGTMGINAVIVCNSLKSTN